ncbi:hypothetical protein Pcinc_002779 [Petrolisthes cinctipes]|uniref:Uncharacterized protein n=1 Tax=Petrolisthes cinctipes TaxID=88211 RepID=A0AAE1L2N0_PETCI|nr:hypothetical protein Pcinc_002779 [Petrolisthes cinctipes]
MIKGGFVGATGDDCSVQFESHTLYHTCGRDIVPQRIPVARVTPDDRSLERLQEPAKDHNLLGLAYAGRHSRFFFRG